MGKVGSQTIERSLKAAQVAMPIYHTHVLVPTHIKKAEKNYYGKQPSPLDKALLPYTRSLFVSYYLRHQLDSGGLGPTRRWKIITAVRDPIARNVSGFFQEITVQIPDFYKRVRDRALTTQELVDTFLEKYQEHDVPAGWFDSELKPTFGVDVFSNEFPKLRGYQIFKGIDADILLLKLENLAGCYRDAFKEFLKLEEFTLVKANEASKKEYCSTYSRFLASARLPTWYIDRMYASKYATHFYTQEELEGFKRKWG